MIPVHPTPYPYQIDGATAAVWKDKTLIADEQGLGKTLQALMAARLLAPDRVLIICPPILATNWAHSATTAGCHPAPTVISSQTPTPDALPETGYIIVSDALIVARKKLATALTQWAPGLLIIDEAHRFKNYRAKRTKTVTAIAAKAGKTICITGTPIVSTPLDVLPLLRILKKTGCFPSNFIDRYTKQDYWGNRVPRREKLPELYELLEQHVWTRRTKAQVLPDLPEKQRNELRLQVTDKALDQAMADLYAEIDALPSSEIDTWAGDALTKVSRLRRATGLAKVPAAIEWATMHLAATDHQRPLIVWGIHKTVLANLADGIRQARPGTTVETINGSTPRPDRDRIVADFQAGKIDVLVAQMVAAGVGLTLTASSDVLFVETDWTPAVVVQAEDRAHRIGTTQSVQITTLIAEGTLDAHIHATLAENITTLDALTPGSDHHVTTGANTPGVKQLLKTLALNRIKQTRHQPLLEEVPL